VNRLQSLSRREREMMDIVYRSGSATAGDVLGQLADPPSYSAVRTTLRILEEKGLLKHEQDGKRYVYKPRLPRDKARKGAMDHLVSTFFGGSASGAVLALLEQPGLEISPEDLRRMQSLIEHARKEGR
jgi:BlaI family transcriptional regulator, penicillinase repressor